MGISMVSCWEQWLNIVICDLGLLDGFLHFSLKEYFPFGGRSLLKCKLDSRKCALKRSWTLTAIAQTSPTSSQNNALVSGTCLLGLAG